MSSLPTELHPPTRRAAAPPVVTPRQLAWWRFSRHRLALVSSGVVALLYLAALLAPFIAPYDPGVRHGHPFAAPQPASFRTDAGFSLTPMVFGLRRELDRATYKQTYVRDTAQAQPLGWLVRGHPYRLLGLFPTDRHLFGAPAGSVVYLMGTDGLGRDVFSRVVYGARISLTIGLVGVVISLVLGVVIGGISGYFGGVTDTLIQRLIEIIRSFPAIPLWMTLAAALPSSWSVVSVYFGITVILSIVGWTDLARVVRGRFLSLRDEEFVTAARLSGGGEAYIIRRHLLPSFASHIIASVTLAIPGMILAETALSFLGIGLRPPALSWGVLLQDAQNIQSLVVAPWLLLPGLFVVVTVLAFNFLGDGLRDAADPYAEAA